MPFPAAPREGRGRSRSVLCDGNPLDKSEVGANLTLNLAKKLASSNDFDMDVEADNEWTAASRDASRD